MEAEGLENSRSFAFDLRMLVPGMDTSTRPRSVGSRAEVREHYKLLFAVLFSPHADTRVTDQRLGTVAGAPLPRSLMGRCRLVG